MDSDRELLEMAARAAGLLDDGYRAVFRDGEGWVCIRAADDKCPFQSVWAPLTDDGDALRLAVKLRLSVSVDDRPAGVVRVYVPDDKVPAQDEPATPDPYAATRRAVVRAAAELGRRG